MTALHSATTCFSPYMLQLVLDLGFTPIDACNASGCTSLTTLPPCPSPPQA